MGAWSSKGSSAFPDFFMADATVLGVPDLIAPATGSLFNISFTLGLVPEVGGHAGPWFLLLTNLPLQSGHVHCNRDGEARACFSTHWPW